jgi:hypothetical protein
VSALPVWHADPPHAAVPDLAPSRTGAKSGRLPNYRSSVTILRMVQSIALASAPAPRAISYFSRYGRILRETSRAHRLLFWARMTPVTVNPDTTGHCPPPPLPGHSAPTNSPSTNITLTVNNYYRFSRGLHTELILHSSQSLIVPTRRF